MTRLVKQLVYGGIYLAIILGIVWLFYRALVPAPTCTDGIRNGGEDGVDCGVAACGTLCPVEVKPLETTAPVIIKNGDGSTDVLIHLENPNPLYGASRVDYTLSVTSADGSSLATRRGTTYVNPAQPSYVDFPLGHLTSDAAKAELQFTAADVQWNALTVDAKGDIQFGVRDEQMTPASASYRYSATVINQSKFTFDSVDVTVLLTDSSGKLVGAGSTVMRTLATGEQRGVVLDWPFAVPGVTRAQAVVTTNVFANANFIRTYGVPGQSQGF